MYGCDVHSVTSWTYLFCCLNPEIEARKWYIIALDNYFQYVTAHFWLGIRLNDSSLQQICKKCIVICDCTNCLVLFSSICISYSVHWLTFIHWVCVTETSSLRTFYWTPIQEFWNCVILEGKSAFGAKCVKTFCFRSGIGNSEKNYIWLVDFILAFD